MSAARTGPVPRPASPARKAERNSAATSPRPRRSGRRGRTAAASSPARAQGTRPRSGFRMGRGLRPRRRCNRRLGVRRHRRPGTRLRIRRGGSLGTRPEVGTGTAHRGMISQESDPLQRPGPSPAAPPAVSATASSRAQRPGPQRLPRSALPHQPTSSGRPLPQATRKASTSKPGKPMASLTRPGGGDRSATHHRCCQGAGTRPRTAPAPTVSRHRKRPLRAGMESRSDVRRVKTCRDAGRRFLIVPFGEHHGSCSFERRG